MLCVLGTGHWFYWYALKPDFVAVFTRYGYLITQPSTQRVPNSSPLPAINFLKMSQSPSLFKTPLQLSFQEIKC